MSTTVFTPSSVRLNFGGVIRSEWRKLFSLRSTWILTSIGVGIVVIFAAFMPVILGIVDKTDPSAGISDEGMDAEIVQQFAVSGLMIGALLWAAAVIVSVAGEYASHSVVSTLCAVPTRTPVYLAKAVVTGVVGFLGGLIFHLISALLVVGLFAAFGIDSSFGGADAFGEAAISGVYVLMLTWLAIGLAVLMRSTAGSIVVLSVLVYLVTSVVQGFAIFVHQDWLTWIGNHLPTSAVDQLRPSSEALMGGDAEVGVGDASDSASIGMTGIATWDAWLTTAVWSLVPLWLGAWSFKRRGVR